MRQAMAPRRTMAPVYTPPNGLPYGSPYAPPYAPNASPYPSPQTPPHGRSYERSYASPPYGSPYRYADAPTYAEPYAYAYGTAQAERYAPPVTPAYDSYPSYPSHTSYTPVPTPRRAPTPPKRGSALGAFAWGTFLLLTLSLMVTLLTHMAQAAPGALVTTAARQASTITTDTLTPHVAATVTGTPPTITAPYAFLYDATTGIIYYQKAADHKEPMASCTKVMTALIAVERGNLDAMVPIKADAASFVRPQSSFMGVSTGEQISLRDLLYGLMLPSGNDAAVAIADYIAGSVPNFAALMNQRAAQLGLTHTHFVTPNGLDLTVDGHVTSARDLAVLSAVAEENPIIRKITSTTEYKIPKTATHKAYDLLTGIDLLPGWRTPYTGAIGVKAGFTGLAQYCESFAAVRGGHMMVGAVLADPSWQVRDVDMRALLNWGFAQIGIPAAPVVPAWTMPPPDTAS